MNQTVKLTIKNIHKSYNGKTILDDISFEVYSGEFLSILGPSGCGKTTLLRILIGITDQDGGRITKDGVDISHLSADKRGMGIVFQNYALFPNMTVLENVAYPLKINKFPKKEALERARAAIDSIGLSDHLDKRPSKLSGGQQQRVAIGRALITRPALILADEPTGNLDTQNTSEVIALLKEASRLYEQTIVMITHSQSIAQTADRILRVSDGVVTDLGRCKE